MNIVVVGSGSWGIALACVLSNNNHKVCLWSYSEKEVSNMIKFRENKICLPGVKIDKKIHITNNIEEALSNKELIITAVPSTTIRENINKMLPYLKQDQIIVNASKGIEEESLKTLSEVIKEVAYMCKVGVISGPSHAEELARNMISTCVVSFKDEKIANLVQEVFTNDIFKIYTNTDIIGVELGGALKNVIAIAIGIVSGLNCGDNAKAALITRGIKEISNLGVKMGANINTFFGLSGIGDLMVTCMSNNSRNRKAGILIAKKTPIDKVLQEIGMVVEGITASKVAHKLSIKYNVEMPIIKSVNDIILNNKDPINIIETLMTKENKSEFN